MADDTNDELARRAWQAVSRSDVDALRDLWGDDIVWHATGRSPLGGDHIGQDAVFDYLAALGELSEKWDAVLEDILVSEDRFAIVYRISGRRGDQVLEVSYTLMARVRDGRVCEVWSLPHDPGAVASFWA